MDTVCYKQLSFGSFFGKQINADLDGGHITSHAGGLLLRELDERYGLTDGIADSLYNRRHPSWVIHHLKTLIKQRIFSIPFPLAMMTTMMHRHCEAILRLRPYQAGYQRHLRI
jgi:hypothetical protein